MGRESKLSNKTIRFVFIFIFSSGSFEGGRGGSKQQ